MTPATLARAHGEGRLEDKLTQFTKPRLLIVDELGYRTPAQVRADQIGLPQAA